MIDIPEHTLKGNLSKFSFDGLRTFRWNELDTPPKELLDYIERFKAKLASDGKEANFKLYYKEYRQHGLMFYEFKNPERSGHLKPVKKKLSKSLNCGNFHPYRKQWACMINKTEYILMRAEIPLNHLYDAQAGKNNRSGAIFYAEIIIRLMYSTYPKKHWGKTDIDDSSLLSQWIFHAATRNEEYLVIYYWKQVMFEVERMYLFDTRLTSGRAHWKKYFLEREKDIAEIRSAVMQFPIQQRTYAHYANAFEFAFQVPSIIDEIRDEDMLVSVQDLFNNGLLLGEHTQKYAKKFREKKNKVNDKIKNTTTLPLFDVSDYETDFNSDEVTNE